MLRRRSGVRVHRGVVGAVLAFVAITLLVPAGASGADPTPRSQTVVIQADGLIDPPNAQLIKDTIRDANRARAELVVIKIASGGAVDVDPAPLVDAIRRSKVPVGVWVGPSGGKAKGIAALLAAAAPVAAVSNGSSIGPADPLRLDRPEDTDPTVLSEQMADLNRANGRSAAGAAAMVSHGLSAAEAVRTGATNRVCQDPPGCPTLGDFIVNLDGKTVPTSSGSVKLDTAKVVGQGRDRRLQPTGVIAFRKLDLVGQAVHTLTSPSIAYFLLVVGLALIVFEFFTISVGLAGGAGAAALVGAFVGFSHLPVTWWALVLVFLAMFGFAIDVQAGRPLVWTGIGTALLVIGSLFLYGGSSRLDVYWWALAVVIVGAVVFMAIAMPVAVRSRFSSPTIDREALVGERGEAAVAIGADGVVLVRSARWPARAYGEASIPAGTRVRVVAADGLVLLVEPDSGPGPGTRDHGPRDTRTGDD